MAEILLFALIVGSAGGAAWLALAPLLPRRQLSLARAPANGVLAPSIHTALTALEELDLDFEMGKLDEADYRTFRESLVAATAGLAGEAARRELVAQLIEAEVARRRAAMGDMKPRLTASYPLQAGADGAAKPGAKPAPGAAPAANRRALLAAGLAASLFLAATGILVADQLGRQTGQRPVATLAADGHNALAFYPRDPDRLFVGHNGGLSVSPDGGRSWSPTTLSGNVRTIVARPTASSPGGLLAAGDGLLAASADDGATWSTLAHDLPGADIRALALDPRDTDRLYAIVEGHGLYESADGGRRWTRLSDRVPPGIAALTIVPGNPPALYAATAAGGVQVADGAGRGWSSASGFVSGALPTLRARAIAHDPNSGDSYVSSDGRAFRGALYVGTDQGLFKSIDGGSSWNRLPLRVAVVALGVAADGRTLAAVDDAGRLFRSRDRGLSWGPDQ